MLVAPILQYSELYEDGPVCSFRRDNSYQQLSFENRLVPYKRLSSEIRANIQDARSIVDLNSYVQVSGRNSVNRVRKKTKLITVRSTVVAPPPYGFDKRNFCLCCRDMNLTTGDYTTYNYGTEDLCDILKWTKSDDGTGQIAHVRVQFLSTRDTC